MVNKTIEPEVKEALKCIENKEDFILTGGAGSGKTYSLVNLIEELGKKYSTKNIICITYTNNAVAEIRSRISNENLFVSTIHEFIWSLIKKYQKEIKETMVELINSDNRDYKIFRKPNDFDEELSLEFFKNKINYDEYYMLRSNTESTISHDHVLILAEKMFGKYEKLCDILIDTADFIFIDEYQDTSPNLIKILLTHLQNREKKNIIGFFGDSMQAIYDEGIGYINNSELKRIDKKQNRRNPKKIIKLANKIRLDGIIQEPSDDENAPNMENGNVIEGSVKFVFGEKLELLKDIDKSEIFKDWNFNNSNETKILNLVHRANAFSSGFEKLFNLYNSDKIYKLVNKIREKIKKNSFVVEENETFENVVHKAEIKIGKGDNRRELLEDVQQDNLLDSYYEQFKDSYWSEVENYRINKESLLSYKFNGLTNSFESNVNRDRILKQLDQIYEITNLYKTKNYNLFLRKQKREIKNFDDKTKLHNDMKFFDYTVDKTIEEIIEEGSQILSVPIDNFKIYINGQGKYLWERIKNISFKEYINSIEYLREYFPYATQHSIKGSEFDNVLIIMDNFNWNKYNYEYIFQNDKTESVTNRTNNLLYVCVTRAKKNLVLFMPTTNLDIIKEVQKLFGKDSVVNINDLIP